MNVVTRIEVELCQINFEYNFPRELEEKYSLRISNNIQNNPLALLQKAWCREKRAKEGGIFQKQFELSFSGATFPIYRDIGCIRLRKTCCFFISNIHRNAWTAKQ